MAEIFYLFKLREKKKEKPNIGDIFFYKYKIKKIKGAYIDRSIEGMEFLYNLIEKIIEEGGYG